MRELKIIDQPRGCGLNADELAAQSARYAMLLRSVRRSRRERLLLELELAPNVDAGLLRETLEIERACCSFFTIEHEGSTVRFRVDDAHAGELATFADALS